MSRDWTPREAYYFDSKHFENTGEHFAEMEWKLVLNGEEEVVHPTKQETELFCKYPYITITSSDAIRELAKKCSEELMTELESYVKDLCETDNFQNNKFYSEELNNDTINKWYNGELDSNFYYREWNDRYLLEYLEEIEDLSEIRNFSEHNKERD